MIFILAIDNGVRKYMAVPAPPSYSVIPDTDYAFSEADWRLNVTSHRADAASHRSWTNSSVQENNLLLLLFAEETLCPF